MKLGPLWRWVREREAIRERRARGEPPPWTKDPILRTYRFCNVRREDDKVTRWIKENIRRKYPMHPRLWFMFCLARQINWPWTLDSLMLNDCWPGDKRFSLERLGNLLQEWQEQGYKVFTGAYIITAGPVKGESKGQFVARSTLGKLWENRSEIEDLWTRAPTHRTLQGAHAELLKYPGWGQFLAYQAVVDMRFTPLLDQAQDRHTWAAAGPGTIRGLNRLSGRPLEYKLKQSHALHEMREIFSRVHDHTGVKIDFSDVPNILCETDKYLRVKRGEGKPRALYVPGRGS